MKQKLIYFEILRGIAILGVVSIHSTSIGYKFENTSFDFIGTVIWRQLINFSVPLFLAISGYFAASKNFENRDDYTNFLKRQLPKVCIPYLFWSIIYIIPLVIKGTSIKRIIFLLVTFQTSFHFYFILLIIQYYILLPVLQKMKNLNGLSAAAVISLLSCLTIFTLRYYLDINIPLYIYAGVFPTWIVFFVLGIYIRANGIGMSLKKLAMLLIIGFIFSILETFAIHRIFNDLGDGVSAIKVSSFFYSTCVILFLFKVHDKNIINSNLLSNLGEISFGIYLSHIILLRQLIIFLDKFIPQLASHVIVYQLVLIIATVVGCCLLTYISRTLNKEISVRYMGC